MKLFLCEKPDQARDIARVLGVRKTSNGCIRGDGVAVTWSLGHMLAQAEPHEYDPMWERWSLDALPIVPPVWKMTVVSKKAGQFKAVQALLAQASQGHSGF